MLKRMLLAFLVPGLIVAASGCVEMKETITLNPDGNGKSLVEFVLPGDVDLGGGGADKSLAEIKKAAITKILTSNKGVTAWKDVSAEWLPDGRLHFTGTAYFETFEAYTKGDANQPSPLPRYKVTHEKDGDWKLSVTISKEDAAKPTKDLPDPKTLSDKELDEYILKQRVQYRQGKGIMVAMLTDFKSNTVIHLPGKIRDSKGFTRDGDSTVKREIDGAALLKEIDQIMARDNAFFRKKIREAGTLKFIEADVFFKQNIAAVKDGSLTLQDVGKDQFDYAKEVKEARAAYPALREKFSIDKNKPLPGEPGIPKASGSLPR